MNEESLFREALARSPSERAAFLDRACTGEPELRAAVEALLAAHEASDATGEFRADDPQDAATGEFTPTPRGADPSIQAATTAEHQGKPAVDTLIAGRYALRERIGEGGMGEVWVAEQTEPVRRKVALKLIKPGMDSRAVLRRFEQERQALAMMDHPNIAKVLDAGLTPAGQPFFVMELVNGLPLTRFCDEMKLTPRERLELFVPICQAVQHAHQKGIVHRDLKPANILVAIVDGRPVPKVIDFGVAKATAGKLIDESLSTQFGAVVGTLEYMSPEQAGFSGEDIDTRADIYSLGVILYELLTGLRPIDARRLKKAALTEMIRIIREEEPSKPSTKLSTDESLPSLAALRQTEPRRLMALLRGDLDWVVMKCLEKRRDRRYETANGLAHDVQRFLDGDPVEARPPSAGYRLGKFLARHKGPVIAAGLLLLALAGGLVGTTYGFVRADNAWRAEKRQRTRAEDNETKAKALAVRERRSKEVAEKRLTQVRKGIGLLGSIFVDLDPEAAAKDDRPLREVLGDRLERASAELEGDSVGDPLDVAELQMTLARSQLGLGNNQKAISLITKVSAALAGLVGGDDARTLQAQGALATGYLHAGKFHQATRMLTETLDRQKTILGPGHPATRLTERDLAAAYSRSGDFDRAIPLMEEMLRRARIDTGTEDRTTAGLIHNLAATYQAAGKTRQALPLHEEAVRLRRGLLGNKHPETLAAMQFLAGAYSDAGELDKAIPLLEETYRLHRENQGPLNPDTLRALTDLAAAYVGSGRHADAAPLLVQAVPSMKVRLGPDHPDTLSAMGNLAQAYRLAKRDDLALPYAEEAFRRKRDSLGPRNPETLAAMNGLAAIYLSMGKRDQALPLLDEGLQATKAKLGANHPDTFPLANNLGALYFQAGQHRRAVAVFEDLLAQMRPQLGDDHPNVFFVAFNLAANDLDDGRVAEAERVVEEWLPRCQAKLPPQNPSTRLGRSVAARVWEAADKAPRAESYRREQVEEALRASGAESAAHAGALASLASNLIAQRKYTDAEPLIREALKIRERSSPDSWQTSNARALLGGALLGQKKYTEAEPLLTQGYEGMKKQEAQLPALGRIRLREAVERLVQLFEAIGKPDEAEKFRQELRAIQASGKGPER
jgi:hypothetical protein